MTCIRRNMDTQNCCNAWQKGIRTIDGQYPDDNREFEIRGGAGILISPITAGILITNTTDPAALEAGNNIELTPNGDHLQIGTTDDISVAGDLSVAGDSTLNGDLNVNGNIYNQGASYESHMEQVYTANDYIIMRDNAVTGLSAGTYAGFQVKLYDGVNDGRLVIDNSGTARVGDVGDEQPLLTRDESANLNDGALLKWDSANSKAVDEGTVGSDTKPIKIVNGVPTAVTNDLVENTITAGVLTLDTNNVISGSASYVQFGKIVMISITNIGITAPGYNIQIITDAPKPAGDARATVCDGAGGAISLVQIPTGSNSVVINSPSSAGNWYGMITYITQ